MEFVVHGGVPRITFHNLEKLSLYYMEKLKDITRDILLPGSLSNLRVLKVHYCPKLNITPIMQFANGLEEFEVTWYNATEILNNSDRMVSKRTSVTMTEIDKTGGGCDHAFLPRLRRLVLQVLPQLISIWKTDSMPPLGSLSNLTELNVQYCNKLRYLLSPCLAQRLDRLELLVIIGCDIMEKLISVEDEKVVVQSSAVAERLTSVSFSRCISPPYLIFGNLRELYISDCPGFCSLFSIGLAQNLMQLESLTVYRCLQMEVILKGEDAEIENEEESERGKRILFPRLVKIDLGYLPKLTCLCSVKGGSTNLCDGEAFTSLLLPSLENIKVEYCQQLTRLNMGSQSSQHLKLIRGSKAWFEGLVWDDENSRSHFHPLFVPSAYEFSYLGEKSSFNVERDTIVTQVPGWAKSLWNKNSHGKSMTYIN
ncbi:hypothetical protein QJS04_geneDACA018090 [Acorus gramineus]|uniref:Disease resistance protein At4g27190-like leucine-rich repeats domain-containing protein n=1 Tax=Acorus gramineus TaxID=55184 RepID=A0AAV9A870_ACOGR|nr:hypothetical protein QJS04_geneDACA018090 [Acorus gramineus]